MPEVAKQTEPGTFERAAEQAVAAQSESGLVPPGYVPSRLGSFSLGTVKALVRSLIPRKKKFSFDAAFELSGYVDRFVGFLPRHVALVFPVGLFLINWSGLFTAGKPLTLMSGEEGEQHLKKLGSSSVYAIREAVKGLRSLILMGFYAHPEVRAQLRYFPQEWVDQKVAERVTKWGLRVPDLLAIAELPGGPEGVVIRGSYREQLRPSAERVDFRDAYTKASEEEIAAARRAAEAAKARLRERES